MKPSRCSFYFDIISRRKKGLFASSLRAALFVLSGFFALGVFLRKAFSKKPYRPKAYTISIGNLVAGGTGKTPFAIFLAEKLVQKHSVGVVLRGYKAKVEKQDEVYLFQQDADPSFVGDEAALIAKNVPQATIFCGKSKKKSAQVADAKGMDVLIVDDAMQHIALSRDVEIVMLDSLNPFGYGYLLPRGLLREPISALKRADLVVITCRNGIDAPPSVEEIIKRHTTAPICKVRFSSLGLFDLQNRACELSSGAKVCVFCAIAKPDQFVATVSSLGFDIVHTEFLPDHATFSQEMLEAIFAKAKGASCLLCTEKDMVKLKNIQGLPIYCLKIGVEIMSGMKHLMAFIPINSL